MSPRPKSNTCTTNTTVMFNVVHPGSSVYIFTHILFDNIQYLIYQSFVVDWFDVLFRSIYRVDTDDVDYDDYFAIIMILQVVLLGLKKIVQVLYNMEIIISVLSIFMV